MRCCYNNHNNYILKLAFIKDFIKIRVESNLRKDVHAKKKLYFVTIREIIETAFWLKLN